MEYSPQTRSVVGYPQRIWRGGTDRGCIEAPHLTRRGDYYYLMVAEGGTGYGHAVTMARATQVAGPYEGDPQNPIVTSWPENFNARHDADHLKPHYFNPQTYLQKAGHGSYVETPTGEVWLTHLCSRPFRQALRCPLGRETAIQKMVWSDDGWLRMAAGGNLAQHQVEESNLPSQPFPAKSDRDDFDGQTLDNAFYAPRIRFQRFTSLERKAGYLALRGQESLSSLNKVSLLAKKLTSVYATITTKMDFSPEIYQHSAGLALYYDNMNYLFLHKTRDEASGAAQLAIIYMDNGERHGDPQKICLTEGEIYLEMAINGREIRCSWSADGAKYQNIGAVYDPSRFSDEYSRYGEFTGAFVGMACVDSLLHRKEALFDFFSYQAVEDAIIE